MAEDDYEEVELSDYDVDVETGEIVKSEGGLTVPEPKKVIKGSASRIKDYLSCPAKAYGAHTYQPQERGFALVNGTAIHEALELYIKQESQVDPHEVYEKALVREAEKNKLLLNTKEAIDGQMVAARCVAAGISILNHTGPSGIPLWKRMDPEYVERFFKIERNGRTYVGKIDFTAFLNNGSYIVGDWKSGKNAPDPYELDNDIQFDMYAYALYADPGATKTFGKFPERTVYMHLRGQGQEFYPSGKRKPAKECKLPLKYDFPTMRTLEQVEKKFDQVIEPVMIQMENGIWYRNEGKACGWCGFFDKKKNRCGVELPCDASSPKAPIDLISMMAESKAKPKVEEPPRATEPLKSYVTEKPVPPTRATKSPITKRRQAKKK